MQTFFYFILCVSSFITQTRLNKDRMSLSSTPSTSMQKNKKKNQSVFQRSGYFFFPPFSFFLDIFPENKSHTKKQQITQNMFRLSATTSGHSSNKLLSTTAACFTPTTINFANNKFKIVIDEEEDARSFSFNKPVVTAQQAKSPSSLSSLFSSTSRCPSAIVFRKQQQGSSSFGFTHNKINNSETKRSRALKHYVENASQQMFINNNHQESATTAPSVSLIAAKKKKVLDAKRDLKIALKELRSATKKQHQPEK